MMITNIIREANTEPEVYFLLTAYIESIQFGDKLNCLSEHLTSLPLTGLDDVRQRSVKLVTELDVASKRLDDKVCVVIKEALEVFGTALSRLELLGQGLRPQCLTPQSNLRLNSFAWGLEANYIENRQVTQGDESCPGQTS
jgi:hypothetical protein